MGKKRREIGVIGILLIFTIGFTSTELLTLTKADSEVIAEIDNELLNLSLIHISEPTRPY